MPDSNEPDENNNGDDQYKTAQCADGSERLRATGFPLKCPTSEFDEERPCDSET